MTVITTLKIVKECGYPDIVSLYDEDGVDGYEWTHPDGRTWTNIYKVHPLLEDFDREDILEAIHNWLDESGGVYEDIIEEQASLLVMSKEELIAKYMYIV